MVSQFMDSWLDPIARHLGLSGADLSETLFTEFVGEGIDSLIDATMKPFGVRLVKGLSALLSYLTLLIPGLPIDSRTRREIVRMGTHLATQAVEYDPNVSFAIQQAFTFGESLVELDPQKMINQIVKTPAEIEEELNKVKAAFGMFGELAPSLGNKVTEKAKEVAPQNVEPQFVTDSEKRLILEAGAISL